MDISENLHSKITNFDPADVQFSLSNLAENNTAGIYETAFDLYQRGLNVFPVPHPREVQAWADQRPRVRSALSKPPYVLAPLYHARLHLCDEACEERARMIGRQCLPAPAKFPALFGATGHFSTPNLAVMLGRTSENLMVIDCDSHAGFRQALTTMQSKDLPFWAYTSSRGGGLLVRLQEGEAKNLPTSTLPDVQIYGRRQYCVIPPSLHPRGVLYTWITTEPIRLPHGVKPPLLSAADLAWLGVKLQRESNPDDTHPSEVDVSGFPEWITTLSRLSQDFLVNGAPYGTRNQRLFICACDMAGNAIDQDEAEAYLFEALRGTDLPAHEAERTIRSAYSQERTPARLVGKPAGAIASAARRFAANYDWRQRGGTATTDYKVFNAAIQRATLENQRVFRCTVREIAEIAHISDVTARKALSRLSGRSAGSTPADRLLVLMGTDPLTQAHQYSFAKQVFEQSADLSQCSPLEHNGTNSHAPIPTTSAEKDVFGKFNLTAWRVWQHLLRTPEKRQVDIVRALGISRDSVGRVLQPDKGLRRYGLVIHEGGCFRGVAASEARLVEIAKILYRHGRSQEKRESHQRERACQANRILAQKRQRWAQLNRN
jgi:hypothetical protein